MLARRKHLNVFDKDHLVVANIEGAGEHIARILTQAAKDFGIRPGHPRGRIAQPRTIRVFPHRDQDLAHGSLHASGVILRGKGVIHYSASGSSGISSGSSTTRWPSCAAAA